VDTFISYLLPRNPTSFQSHQRQLADTFISYLLPRKPTSFQSHQRQLVDTFISYLLPRKPLRSNPTNASWWIPSFQP